MSNWQSSQSFMKKRSELRLDVAMREVEQLLKRLNGVKVLFAVCQAKDIRIRIKVRSQKSLALIANASGWSNLVVSLHLDYLNCLDELPAHPRQICYVIHGKKRRRPDEAADIQMLGASLAWEMKRQGLLDPKEASRVCRALNSVVY